MLAASSPTFSAEPDSYTTSCAPRCREPSPKRFRRMRKAAPPPRQRPGGDGLLAAARMSFSCGMRGRLMSVVTETTAEAPLPAPPPRFPARAPPPRSRRAARCCSRRSPPASPAGCPEAIPPAARSGRADPSPQMTRSYSILPSVAASTVAVWNASASASAGSLTLYSSEAPRGQGRLDQLGVAQRLAAGPSAARRGPRWPRPPSPPPRWHEVVLAQHHGGMGEVDAPVRGHGHVLVVGRYLVACNGVHRFAPFPSEKLLRLFDERTAGRMHHDLLGAGHDAVHALVAPQTREL